MNLIVLIAAVVLSFLIFTWLLQVAKATLTTALTVAFLVLLLQLIFGVGPNELWQQIVAFWQVFTQWFSNL